MSDDDPDSRRLKQLEDDIRKARGPGEVRDQESPPSKMGIAFRLVADLLAGVIVGGGIGWALDRVFGTSPILLILMFLVGAAAGIRNVMRTARALNEEQGRTG